MKIIITEDQKKKLFIPRKIDEREVEHQKIIDDIKEKIKNTPIGKLSKESIFEWIQENNLDQDIKLNYKGPSLGSVVGTSYNKNTGEVTLFIDNEHNMNIGIKFFIKDIKIGYYEINAGSFDDNFYPID